MKTNINLDTRLSDAADFWGGDFVSLPANETFELIADYPLDKAYSFPIKTGKSEMGLPRLIREIGKIYNKIYDNEEKYGIWGHGIDDLHLTGIKVDYVKKTIKLDIDS